MSQDQVAGTHFSPDIEEFLRLLHQHGVRYLIAGGEAVIYYGYARLTGDVDFFYDGREANARRLYRALNEFWGGDIPGVRGFDELMETGLILQFGRPPNRIDLLNAIDGVKFSEAWETRMTVTLVTAAEEVPIYYIGLDMLIENKQAAGRPKDLEDLAFLRRAARRGG